MMIFCHSKIHMHATNMLDSHSLTMLLKKMYVGGSNHDKVYHH